MSEQAETAPTTQEEQKTEAPTEEKDVKENGTGEAEPVAEQEKEAPKEMRAVVLNGFGGLKSVKILKKPEPALNEGEVLIRVKACGLNFQDLMVRQGAIDSPPKCPFILGFECAGEIEQVAEGVEGFAVGDQVVALPEFRAWAELVAVPAKYVFKLPKDISHLDAAAITMNYAVAYILLFEVAGLSKGKSILVHSVGGGVGQAVVQLAKTVPDVTIFGICSKGKHEALKSANSPIDHLLERGSDYVSEIRKVSPDGIDIVLDCLCGEECNKGYSLLKPMGKYILYGSSNVVTGETKSFFSAARSWWQVDKISPLKLFDENRTISGFNLRRLLFQQGGHEFVHKAVQEVFALFQQKKIKPLVDSTWALEDVAEAMQKMHDRKNVGKLILDPSLEPKPKPATPAKGKNKEDKKKQSSEEKKDSEEKKEEEKKEEKKEEQLTNGDSAGDSDSKGKENSS
ncbi:synaptic vesicle membrane protein VAT-1 homolog-like isoform X1 [Tribolium castaneum]|uniref:Synaptic vesicle membrane protein VAT-1 homolog-like n=1 Tax=Tribolium castaneum TaxID=7070 RepID=A0A139WFI3_TRICA|nr:PREDICTED: synaptic vesicle membrane protein VAT-1 homolog-like isoform X1 [Tribolium castaneum]KYB26740.1 Synaptic vesicle membrane protein VAT-1 homolog-like [Tribolium castaneum]|eukprot:XP_008195541.1 PREDICTED: synaptic vesicle membrane protein VAT-1 homolog-like isoform X1 [Tribolium castaneum]